MIYLIEQLFWFLLIAFVVGLVVGWMTFTFRKTSR